jgi:cytochrome c peroxidase
MRAIDKRDLGWISLGAALGFAAVALAATPPATSPLWSDARLRQEFARPGNVPQPAAGPPTPQAIALGELLFNDVRLSADARISCATCHDMKLGLADGVRLSQAGATGKPLQRHTPTLWNVAWSPLLMWDGRAEGLEQQAVLPLSHPDEMASSPQQAAERLAADAAMRTAFAAAFPAEPRVSAANLLAALAAYQRTLVSPPTRFDQWVSGDDDALTAQERHGLSLFAGKAGCISCHTGFAFTDQAFHDVGLPTSDAGRGPVAGLAAATHAFKTPTLRELAWTAPYMHDGAMETLEDVVRHYEGGGIARPSRSREMPSPFALTDDERAALVAFLETLSSDAPPRPSAEVWVRRDAPAVPAKIQVGATTISQRGRTFTPASVRIRRGDRLTVLNDDTRTHNVRIAHPDMDFNSGAQEPGENVVLRFNRAGTFEAHCGIHPTMRLRILVD